MHWTDSRLRACEMTVALSVLLSAPPPMQGGQRKHTSGSLTIPCMWH
jgi:hypothetical protein